MNTEKLMKKIISLILTLSSLSVFAENILLEKTLWLTEYAGNNKNVVMLGCISTKAKKIDTEICFKEQVRSDQNQPIKAKVAVFANGKSSEYIVAAVSKLVYLGTTRKYVFNAKKYSRAIVISDSAGKRSELIEEINFYEGSTADAKVATRSISGFLPDGTKIPVLAHGLYWFPALLKGYASEIAPI
jgi:hypothetical protein